MSGRQEYIGKIELDTLLVRKEEEFRPDPENEVHQATASVNKNTNDAQIEEDFEWDCNRCIEQVAKAPLYRDFDRKIKALQLQFEAAKMDGTDFALIGTIGKSIQAHKLQCAQLSLSEEDYLSLPTRHAALVQKMEANCKRLLQAECFDALTLLGTKLNTLKAVDLSAFPDPGDMDPVLEEGFTGAILTLGPVSAGCKPVVVCIHFGAAYSGVAYTRADDPGYIRCGAPTALDPTQMKVPTALLELPNGQWKFGYEAEADSNRVDPSGSNMYRRFRTALNGKSSGFETLTAKSVTGKEHNLLDLVARSLKFLMEFAIDKILTSFDDEVQATRDVQWVLTIPAIWNDFSKAFMRKAAFKAGLIDEEHSDNLLLVLEPEAACLAVHMGAANQSLLHVGSRFMVLDCGGGKIDITVHEVRSIDPLKMRTLAITGGDWGADYVNIEFNKFLKELLGDLVDEFKQPREFYFINSEFEKTKKIFDPNTDPMDIRLRDVLDKPADLVRLANHWNAKHPDKLIIGSPTPRNGSLTMSKELMLSFFEPGLKKTVDETRRVMGEIPGVRYIMVVGGFGSSKVLTTRICDEFHNKRGVTVILPDPRPKPQGAIVHGAVFFGLYKDIIYNRVAQYTYGDRITIRGVADSFCVWVRKGQELPSGFCYEAEALPEIDTQTAITYRFYRSDKLEPKKTVGEHCLGELEVPCPPNEDMSKRKQKLVAHFIGSEIHVSVVNGEGEILMSQVSMV